jgi:hypothetical protein
MNKGVNVMLDMELKIMEDYYTVHGRNCESDKFLQDHLGYNIETIKKNARRLGFKSNKMSNVKDAPESYDFIRRVKFYYTQGLTVHHISKLLDCSYGRVCRAIMKLVDNNKIEYRGKWK